jgi:hypothetical protein
MWRVGGAARAVVASLRLCGAGADWSVIARALVWVMQVVKIKVTRDVVCTECTGSGCISGAKENVRPCG